MSHTTTPVRPTLLPFALALSALLTGCDEGPVVAFCDAEQCYEAEATEEVVPFEDDADEAGFAVVALPAPTLDDARVLRGTAIVDGDCEAPEFGVDLVAVGRTNPPTAILQLTMWDGAACTGRTAPEIGPGADRPSRTWAPNLAEHDLVAFDVDLAPALDAVECAGRVVILVPQSDADAAIRLPPTFAITADGCEPPTIGVDALDR